MAWDTVVHDLLHRIGIDVTRWPRRFDEASLDWTIAQVVRRRRINCVLDVGANKGQFGQRMRGLGYNGRIISFEPSPNMLSTLTERAERDGSWQVRPVGLSSEPGTAEMHHHVDGVFDSLHSLLPKDTARQSHGRPELLNWMRETGTSTISLSTLAAEFPDATAGISDPRVLLKSDTQGHDVEVLAGAKGLPAEVVAVLVELSAVAIYEDQPPMTQVIDLLFAEGFTPAAFSPVSWSPDDDLRMVELDGLFLRPANHAS